MTNADLPQPTPLVRALDSTQSVMPVHKAKFKVMKIFGGLAIILVLLLVAGLVTIVLPGRQLLASVKQLEASGSKFPQLIKDQDLGGVSQQLQVVSADLNRVEQRFSRFGWLRVVPIARNYYLDGQRGFAAAKELMAATEVTVSTVTPYADILGLKGLSGTGDGAQTAQDRINFVITTLDKLKPQFATIGEHLKKASDQVDQIDPGRYPENFRGQPIRQRLVEVIALLDQATSLVNDAAPFLESVPYMLGLDSPRKYLVIFQNDAELRPTGGFMTAYAILSVDKGKISTVQSDDIYALDAKFTKKIPAPEPIVQYLPKVPYWYLRDQNISPDFKVSMETFFPNYQLTGSPEVDGVIAMDTQVLVDLLKITGQIGVPGFGNFSADEDPRCKCPQVWYELELYADVEGPVVWDSVSGQIIVQPKNYGQRKSFIGPIMHSVLANVMAQPKTKMAELFSTGIDLINQKHVQFYFPNSEHQTAVESFNLAGRIRESSQDYLMVVDTNFAGAKTNAWVTYSAEYVLKTQGSGKAEVTLTLTYKNPQQFFQDEATKLRLNGVFRDWLRVYVPQGSQLIEAKGFESGQKVTEDLGKTVFEGFFTLTPLNTKQITLKYSLPMEIKKQHQILIQKQAGAKAFPYILNINGRKLPEFMLTSDKEFTTSL